MGKVSISVKGSYKTLNTLTEGEEIPTGAIVNIVSVEGNSILIVKNIIA
jgi:membrane protein implicated in regulation of membrane protease activity